MGLSSFAGYGSFRQMNQAFIYIALGGLIAWSLYRRVRRSIGRQKLRPGRIIFRLVLFCVAVFFIILAGIQYPPLLAGFGAGVLGGVVLGFVSLRLTKFETTEEGHFYTPDMRIGVAISFLVVGRVIYRMAILKNAQMSVSAGHPPPGQSPLTLFIFGLMFGYYIVYYIGLFVHTHDKTPITAPSSPAPPKLSERGPSPS